MISSSFYCIVPLCPITAPTLAAKRPKNFGAVRTTFHNRSHSATQLATQTHTTQSLLMGHLTPFSAKHAHASRATSAA